LHRGAAYAIIPPVLCAPRLVSPEGPGVGAASEASYVWRPLQYGLLVAPPISGSLGAFSHA
jgi:hypothetical protein